MTEQQEHKTVRMSEITPEILENINVGDWIEGIGDIGCYYDRKIIRIVGTWLRRFTPPNKDGVHWITGQELREIYADNLSLDKYDEIRKRSVPAYEAMLAESLTEDQTRTLLMWLVRNKKEMFSQIVCPACKEDVAEKAAAEARKDEREKVLKLISNTDRGACPYDTCIRSADMRCRDCLIQWIEVESLRSEVKTL